ncbi:MAG TPA: Gfo/Idh/MocA family oxidoreductase [Mesorhizobium sp.]|jgi:predicted dehydrogenase
MKIAFLGTGFVADYYMASLANYSGDNYSGANRAGLELAGAFDRDAARLAQFCDYHHVRAYDSVEALLADESVGIVVNLTTPESHFETSRRALLAGKHVYCEKPLAMRFEDARILVELADELGLTLATAPANALSAAHSLVAGALDAGRIGTPRLVYAEMEDGAVFRDKWTEWRSRSGAKWPGAHEFEIGCTLEHAGYALSWLTSLFGPVESLTAFSALAFPDKGPGTQGLALAPDFSVGCLAFKSGVVARLTSGLAAPKDRSLTILGDNGSITVRDLWDEHSTIHLETENDRRSLKIRLTNRLESRLGKFLPWKPTVGRRLTYPATSARKALPGFPSQIDFCAGIAAQASAITEKQKPQFSGALALHITELALALNNARNLPQPYRLKSTF